jgi:predicted PurR-regulated permease PerM
MGFVGFILGPVLIALAVVGFKIFADLMNAPANHAESRATERPENP